MSTIKKWNDVFSRHGNYRAKARLLIVLLPQCYIAAEHYWVQL